MTKERQRAPRLFTCATCQCIEDSAHWLNGRDLLRLALCQECFLWTSRVKDRDSPGHVRMCHVLFLIADVEPRDASARHTRVEHVVRFRDGRVVRTANLYFIGAIPKRFRAQLPDNAEWGDD